MSWIGGGKLPSAALDRRARLHASQQLVAHTDSSGQRPYTLEVDAERHVVPKPSSRHALCPAAVAPRWRDTSPIHLCRIRTHLLFSSYTLALLRTRLSERQASVVERRSVSSLPCAAAALSYVFDPALRVVERLDGSMCMCCGLVCLEAIVDRV